MDLLLRSRWLLSVVDTDLDILVEQLNSCAFPRGVSTGAVSSRGHWTASGDVFGYYHWGKGDALGIAWVKARALYLTSPRAQDAPHPTPPTHSRG